MNHYDAIIVGAGAGGGVVAGLLAEAGKRVLVIERGRNLSFEEIGRDHLRNHRLAHYGHNTGPELEGNQREFVEPNGEVHVAKPHSWRFNNNAMAVGGGTRVYGAQAWRFLPDDFRMASRYGVPAGSSLADWPISYHELAPYYNRAEWEIGVAGDNEGSNKLWPRDKQFPMPHLPLNLQGQTVRKGLEKLGWSVLAPPVLINTVPYNNRPACAACQHCVGFGCPVDAKNGSQNTMLARALATGRCELQTEAIVDQITTNQSGVVTGVSYFDRDGQHHEVHSDIVVVSAGAIETARLLLNSRSKQHPNGLGNQYDQVGRHLQGHYYPGAWGQFDHDAFDMQGPGISSATCEFNHGNDGIIGGGMLCDEFIVLPIIFWKRMLPPDAPRWGAASKQFMRENYRRIIRITGPVQEIPSPEARVTVSPNQRDRWGIPVARLSGTTHPETVRSAEFMRDRAVEWMRACGAKRVWTSDPQLGLSAGQHQAGTCRMGDDPRSSVTDSWGRVHGHDNLFIADGSLHVTNGGFNPVLTILALAFRVGEGIITNH